MSLMTNWLESLHVDITITSRCIRHKYHKSTCEICLDACKENAISTIDLTIDCNKCTTCGNCLIECPVNAIDGIPLNRQFEKNSLVYNATFTPLLKELLIYKKKGINSILINETNINHYWEKVLQEANKVLFSIKEDPISIKVRKEERLTRRDLFTAFKGQGRMLAKSLSPAVWQIEVDSWKLSKYYPEIQFHEIELDEEQCNMCEACFSNCPEKVFSFIDKTLVIEKSNCTNCKVCVEICIENALKISSEVKNKKDIAKPFFEKICRSCEKPFKTFHKQAEKCHICMNRDPTWLSP